MTNVEDFSEFVLEENLTQECKEFITSLPKENLGSTPIYQYEGCWLHGFQVEGILACQKYFQAHDTDILLATTPKSGTTWLKAIVFALVNREGYYSVDDLKDHPLLTKFAHDLVPFLELGLYLRGNVPDLSSLASPRLVSTHMPYTMLPSSVKESSCKIVYSCRDPKDVLVSSWLFGNNILSKGHEPVPLDEFYDCYSKGLVPYGPYEDLALGYFKERLARPEKIFFLKYEEMKKQPDVQIRKLAEFLGRPFTQDEEKLELVDKIIELCSFKKMSNLASNKSARTEIGVEGKAFFRRGEMGDWKTYLTPAMAAHLDEAWNQTFIGYDLKY